MKIVQSAIKLAARGFYVFPVVPNKKVPMNEGWQEKSTRDLNQIKTWWGYFPKANIGTSTSRFLENLALCVIDVDNKPENGRDGLKTFNDLKEKGFKFPVTFTVKTPTGGFHIYYYCKEPVKQGVNVLGEGIDIRSKGGLVIGPGSMIDGKFYEGTDNPVVECPEWILEKCGKSDQRPPRAKEVLPGINEEKSCERAISYLKESSRVAHIGERNQTAYVTACVLKDYGVNPTDCFSLMLEHWKCEPMLDRDELKQTVDSAYIHGKEPVGVMAPETQFDPVVSTIVEGLKDDLKSPVEELNKEYAFVIIGSKHRILWETKDIRGNPIVKYISEETFHARHNPSFLPMGDGRSKAITKIWMSDKRRRTYDGTCFLPECKEVNPKFYNLWRGFSFKPLSSDETPTTEMKRGVELYLEHALKNVCDNNESLFKWLIGWFAHLIQHPYEKPRSCLVLTGGMGVGKNTLVEHIGALFKDNFFLAGGDPRYLLSNFNSHLERTLMFVLDEAFWSGDKQAEGVLKHLITGTKHVIEQKGLEPYLVDNFSRICILGNEDWVVPVRYDDRRFAVFKVEAGRRNDSKFFGEMQETLNQGGYRYLLTYLLNYDLSGIDINQVPKTKAHFNQKTSSLSPFNQWWFECLKEEYFVGTSEEEWNQRIQRTALREGFTRYCNGRKIGSWAPDSGQFKRLLQEVVPSIKEIRTRDGDTRERCYLLPDLEACRKEFNRFMGYDYDWENED